MPTFQWSIANLLSGVAGFAVELPDQRGALEPGLELRALQAGPDAFDDRPARAERPTGGVAVPSGQVELPDRRVAPPELGRVADGLRHGHGSPQVVFRLLPLPADARDLALEPPDADEILAGVGAGRDVQGLPGKLAGPGRVP